MSTNDRPFLTRPLVIDWLQYNAFPEKLGELDYPQITLSLIEEYLTAIATQAEKIRELEGENKRLKGDIVTLRTALEGLINFVEAIHKDHVVAYGPEGCDVKCSSWGHSNRCNMFDINIDSDMDFARQALNPPQAGEKGGE